MLTLSPMTQKGPMLTFSPIVAESEMIADGWIKIVDGEILNLT